MFEGKIAIVTGGTRGIGREIALSFARNGADVAVFATKVCEASESLIKEIGSLGRRAAFFPVDVSSTEEVAEAVNKVVAELGSVDILVNNAGITKDGLLLRMSENDFDSVINVNLKGCFNTVKACLGIFTKKRSGKIINISSVVGLMGNAGQVNYASSKAGIVGFTKSVAKEYASRGITVNAVAPGFISTDMTEKMTEEAKKAVASQIPLRRLGGAEDIAKTVMFLASDAASYITGEVIKVDGGLYI